MQEKFQLMHIKRKCYYTSVYYRTKASIFQTCRCNLTVTSKSFGTPVPSMYHFLPIFTDSIALIFCSMTRRTNVCAHATLQLFSFTSSRVVKKLIWGGVSLHVWELLYMASCD